jgi:anti-sigma factor RsiW
MSLDHLPRRELEKLSAYLDGELKPRQARRVEARLQVDPNLQRALRELQAVSRHMRALPQTKLPRSFILTPEMVGAHQRRTGYPILRFATALAAFALVATVGIDLFSTTLSGAMSARSMDQVMAEAPAAVELELADAAKSEAVALDEEIEADTADTFAGAEAPAEEVAGEGLAVAEPATEQEDTAAEERILGESEAPAEPQAAVPEMTVPAQEEMPLAYSATVLPEADAMANQIEPIEPLESETFAQAETRSTPTGFWIRGIEAGLALLTLVLGALTIWARKQSR